MSNPILENLWDELDSTTQEWLRANPGSVILPRSLTEALVRASGPDGSLGEVDRKGQLTLAPQDQAFIKSVAAAAPVGHPVAPGTP
ncbi:hypothetical protein [Arthrobacter sp. PsM3]|uniref:hypothetical protein n=1 Tax=Arthrobacter sp. PsM3 TaxID=3030531 RepID=UPI00263AD44B|nr:hypothetical protein [Arthrobacter sp. PsM3]MDN4644070.1 hypothetical protein [Arthrobacter sp. PsM3]